jgi:hypothetical protein
MNALDDLKRALRKRSELYLRIAVLRELAKGHPGMTPPPFPAGGWFWRFVFVPAYRRIPWSVKEQAMHRFGMTARGWTPPSRRPAEPWRPPPQPPPP